MYRKRLAALLLALCLLAGQLTAVAEQAVPGSTAVDMSRVLNVQVTYLEEPEWDGKQTAQVAVTLPAGSSVPVAENVVANLYVTNGLTLPDGIRNYSLGDIEAGQTRSITVPLWFDHSVETPDEVPVPTLEIVLTSSTTDITRYTCELDGTTEPRAMVLGWELTDVGPVAVQTDIAIMEETFRESYYNKRPFRVESGYNEGDFNFSLSRAEMWETDANDVTYIYINAHGALDDDEPIPAFFANTSKRTVNVAGKEYTDQSLVPYTDMLTYLDDVLEGRVVIITEICYSGQILQVADELGLDSEKFSILTAAPEDEPSTLWPDEIELDYKGILKGMGFTPWKVDALYSYGWFTNDLCDLLDAGYAADENRVVTIGAAYDYLHDAVGALQTRIKAATGESEQDDMPEAVSGMDDFWDALDVNKERVLSAIFGSDSWAVKMDRADALDVLKQAYLFTYTILDPQFAGERSTLLYCSSATYDDDRRKLIVMEEKVEYFSALELYYEYLRQWMVPDVGLARRDDPVPVAATDQYNEQYWATLYEEEQIDGLLSALVCDLDKNGTLDMLTLTVTQREEVLIEATQVYFSVNLELYQIVDGQVVRTDMAEDIIIVNEKHSYLWGHMTYWLNEYDGQITFSGRGYYTGGMSYDGAMLYTCGFRDGRIVEAPERPSLYNPGYYTEDGRDYQQTGSEIGSYPHMGDGIAFTEFTGVYFYQVNYMYNAQDYTNTLAYVLGEEPPQVYKPLKLVLKPQQTPSPAEMRGDEVRASVDASIASAMSAAGKEAYNYVLTCKRDTGEASQLLIYPDESPDRMDAEKLRQMALAVLTDPNVNAAREIIAVVQGVDLSAKFYLDMSGYWLELNQIPDGSYVFAITMP